ncbi:ABC transporter ATP-binding protein [Gulosibacter chungangensis]|uniref:ABC transporter ATP-binding protein n=1 Tax=Gulosibacter chungangensis TaxID=979746 RepID=A0A7J5BEN3_9MICO|nr:ABC transporter ATP-binding protein [Gulosibacter chungangensis]KAB1644721.1 ABC transporter ATP-binding protein [Gulosibacter chungangensis]
MTVNVGARSASSQPGSTTAGTVEFRGVTKSFPTADGAHLVLRDISLTIPPRHIVALIGASGSGKSTLLRLAAGLGEGPTTGEATIDRTPVQPYDSRCGVAFQEARLLPWRSVFENVSLGLPRSLDKDAGKARVRELLELVGLSEFTDHRPREISGGMAQRTSLARALARDPEVLLLDEPFGALDALTRLRMHDLLLDIHAASPTTVLFVTHDVDEALKLADTVLVLGKEERNGETIPGATVIDVVEPKEARPRSTTSDEFGELRHRLLDRLGVELSSEA